MELSQSCNMRFKARSHVSIMFTELRIRCGGLGGEASEDPFLACPQTLFTCVLLGMRPWPGPLPAPTLHTLACVTAMVQLVPNSVLCWYWQV